MNRITVALALLLSVQAAIAQNAPTPPAPAAAPPAAAAPTTPPVEDFKAATSNQGNKQYPQVNSEGRARFRITAPAATSVRVSLGGGTPLTKAEDGSWVGTTRVLDEGFHYYTVNIDGAEVPDPNSMYFYGSSRWGSGIEIPAKDQDFYALKNVPHGQLRQTLYFAKSTNAVRQIFVYTPPDYDKDPSKRYPVLYLQHGAGEDETGWGAQGRTGLIMDNLLAEGKAKPFIIVMENGGNIGGGGGGRGGAPGGPGRGAPGAAPAAPGAQAPTFNFDTEQLFSVGAPAAGAGAPGGGRAGRGAGGPGGPGAPGAPGAGAPGGRGAGGGRGGMNFSGFENVLIQDLIPYIDANFRTIADQPHRAMAGLSMGGMQTRSIALAHLDTFSHIGVFSGGAIATTDITDMPTFKDKVKLVFVSYGSREGGAQTAKPTAEALQQAGVKSVFYVSPDTAHEWQSWRRSLHQFAPLLFQN